MTEKKSLNGTTHTINGSKVLGVKWSNKIGAYLGTILEQGWGMSCSHAEIGTWNREGKQLGYLGSMRPGYNLL